MTPEEAIQIGDEVLVAHAGNRLTDIQRMILRESLAGKGYEQMVGYDVQHIKNEGSQLWKLLSEVLGERVSKKNFKGALEKRLKAGDIVPKPPLPSSYDEQIWVGREALITDLLSKLQGQTRLLWITGISGIGKTTLGECLASQAWESDPIFHWIYLEVLEGQSPDFPSVAANLLDRLGNRDLDPQERNNPDQLARRLLQKLQSHPYWIQIDATEFVDAYWATFFQRCLTSSAFASRLVLTSQAFPNALIEFNDRYPNIWTEIRLDGLLQVEQQLEFFAKRGIAVDSPNGGILTQIAKTYEGHPLVLKVIAEDILKDFVGDVARYWQVYQREFEQVARELQVARPGETEYNEALNRKVRERIKKSLEQLLPDALNLLCRSAVFRRPVPKTFWLTMITECTPQQQKAAYRMVSDRALIEQEGIHQNQRLIRQHNLIRDIAYDLLREDAPIWEASEHKAAELWLTAYEPAPDAPNLEKVRGQIEAFHHYCKLKDWEKSQEILLTPLNSFDGVDLSTQLEFWGYYQERINMCQRLLNKATSATDILCLGSLGNCYLRLANYQQATIYYQQCLSLARRVNDRRREGSALGNLGLVSYRLANYQQAIEYHQQDLAITREIGDRQAEGNALGNLGLVYKNLGSYFQAIEYQHQSLNIAHELGNLQGEASTLGNLGNLYSKLGNYLQAIECQQQSLNIARKLKNQQNEANALCNLGVIHYHLNDYLEAVNYFQQYLRIVREIGDRLGESTALSNLGEIFIKLERYTESLEKLQLSLKLVKEIGDRQGEGIALVNWGYISIKLRQYSDALELLKSSLEIFRKIGDRANEAEAFLRLAQLHQQTGEIDLAREYCDQALALANELGIPLAEECRNLKEQLEGAE